MSKITYEEARGTLDDINNKLAGENASQYLECLKAVGRGENPFSPKMVLVPGYATWESKGDLIYITLPPSQGVTGPQWIEYFKEEDINLSDDAKAVLESTEFQPTIPGTVHKIVALRGTFWKKNSERTNKAIQAEGVLRKWPETHPEAVCIVRKCFSDKQLEKMGLWYLVGIHKPIEVHGRLHFLRADRYDRGRWLYTVYAKPDSFWSGDGAFFWSLPQENQS